MPPNNSDERGRLFSERSKSIATPRDNELLLDAGINRSRFSTTHTEKRAEPPAPATTQNIPSATSNSNVSKKKGITFAAALHSILSKPDDFGDIITWQPHGRAWKIIDPKALEKDVIPHYFRHGHLASFMRQVNGWGFKRIAKGPDKNAYFHKSFLRGHAGLSLTIRRPTIQESKLGRWTYAELIAHTPDFYAMDPMPSEEISDKNGKTDPTPDKVSRKRFLGGQEILHEESTVAASSPTEGRKKSSQQQRVPANRLGLIPASAQLYNGPTSGIEQLRHTNTLPSVERQVLPMGGISPPASLTSYSIQVMASFPRTFQDGSCLDQDMVRRIINDGGELPAYHHAFAHAGLNSYSQTDLRVARPQPCVYYMTLPQHAMSAVSAGTPAFQLLETTSQNWLLVAGPFSTPRPHH